jgi:hypothetical protein
VLRELLQELWELFMEYATRKYRMPSQEAKSREVKTERLQACAMVLKRARACLVRLVKTIET